MSKEIITVVCRQNVGRSQMGEGFLRERTKDDPEICVRSAGIDITGMKEKYHNHPHPKVIFVMDELGINIALQEITQVTSKLLEDSTRIIVLTGDELPDYFQEFDQKTTLMPIEDPAPGTTDDVQLEKLRIIRDQIGWEMSQLDLSYNS